MGEASYEASVSGIKSGAGELQRLAGEATRLVTTFIEDYKATAGWQGSGDSLAVSLTPALESEFKGILDACDSITRVLDSAAAASDRQAQDVRQPVADAVDMINEAKGRH